MNNIIKKFEAFDSSYYSFLDTKPTYEKIAVFEKQDSNTIVYADRAVQVRFLNFTAAWQAATEQSQKEIAEKDALITELEDYKNSVIDQFVTAHHSYDESISAYENISKLIAYHQDIALDPKVSSVAARWVTQIEALQAREKVLVETLRYVNKELSMYGYQYESKDSINVVLNEALATVRGE